MSISLQIPCPACGSELKLRDRSLLGRRGKCPKCGHQFILQEPAAVELELAEPTESGFGGGAHALPDFSSEPIPPKPTFVVKPAEASVAAGPFAPIAETAAPLKTMRRRNRRQRWTNLVIGLLLAVAAGGIGFALWKYQPPKTTSDEQAAESEAAANDAAGENSSVAAGPTAGEPISMQMVPAGAAILLHIRCRDLWQADSVGEEFRFCLGPLAEFVQKQIETLCKRPPQEIESVLFAWLPGPRGTAPDLALVVRLHEDAKKTDLLDQFGGSRVDTWGHPVYINGETASVLLDLKTFAIAPAKLAEDMVGAISNPNPLPGDIEQLLLASDRERHVTLLLQPTAVQLDQEFLIPPSARPLVQAMIDWFGEASESVLWSLHLEPDRFHSQILVRNEAATRPAALEERFREQLDQLPKDLLGLVRLMQPRESGKRQLIGRLPAMLKVSAMSTSTNTATRRVQLVTDLPDRGAPNLALASLLAWDESTRTDFGRTPTTPQSPGDSKPAGGVAERLLQKLDIDFRKTPLQDAFAYIGDEIKVPFVIDGDALKLSGYTKNMEQNIKLDGVTALAALAEILKKYDKMCLVVDEEQKLVHVSTYPTIEQQGRKPFKLP